MQRRVDGSGTHIVQVRHRHLFFFFLRPLTTEKRRHIDPNAGGKPFHLARTPDLLLRLSAPMTLSPEAVWLQDEWSAKLERTTHELAKAANEAAKKYEAYLNAMTLVGQL